MKQPHCHVMFSRLGDATKFLECHRCKRRLPGDQFGSFRMNAHIAYDPRDGGAPRNAQFLHPWCFQCRNQAKGEHARHALYTPDLDRYWSKRASAISASVQKRGLVCLLDKDDLLGKCLEQENRCALTGKPMTFTMGGMENRRTQASVDRIDSDGNYEIRNVQIVCNIVNVMKSDMTMAEFHRWCGLVMQHKAKGEDDLLAAIG
jgi:hypothetical protein